MEVITGKITEFSERGALHIVAPYDNTDRLIKRQYDKVIIGLSDGRKASPEQLKKAHALIGEIAEWSGDLPEQMKKLLKIKFITQQQNELYTQIFSFANCDMTIAKEFITYLIDFILEWNVPTKLPLSELCDDIKKYIYACLRHKKCAVCGKKAELHHKDHVGSGFNRVKISHLGKSAQSLCRDHHTEVHANGQKTFDEKYHLQAEIVLDKDLCKIWKLKDGEECAI